VELDSDSVQPASRLNSTLVLLRRRSGNPVRTTSRTRDGQGWRRRACDRQDRRHTRDERDSYALGIQNAVDATVPAQTGAHRKRSDPVQDHRQLVVAAQDDARGPEGGGVLTLPDEWVHLQRRPIQFGDFDTDGLYCPQIGGPVGQTPAAAATARSTCYGLLTLRGEAKPDAHLEWPDTDSATAGTARSAALFVVGQVG